MAVLSNIEDKIYLQKNLLFWNGLSADEQKLVLLNASVSQIETGTQLVRNSSECNGLILLKKGQIRAFITSEDGREITLYRLFPSDICIMSASCILKNVRFTVYLEVERTGTMIVIPSGIFKRINNSNLEVKEFAMNLMSERFSDVMWIIDQMVFSSIPTRLSHFLLEQSQLMSSDKLEFTHDAISKNIGTAREVVSRMLKYFEKNGMLKLSRGSILLIDKIELAKLSN